MNGYSTKGGDQFVLATQHAEGILENTDASFSERNMKFDLHSHPDSKSGPSGHIYSPAPNSKVTDYYSGTDAAVVNGRYERMGNSYPNHYVYNADQTTIYHYTPWYRADRVFKNIDSAGKLHNVIFNKNYSRSFLLVISNNTRTAVLEFGHASGLKHESFGRRQNLMTVGRGGNSATPAQRAIMLKR